MGDSNSADNSYTAPEEGHPVPYDGTSTIEESGQSQPCITKTVHTISQEARDDSNGASMMAIAKGESSIAPPTQSRRDQLERDNTIEGIEGGCTFRVLTFYDLRPATELSGSASLRVWWHIASCHYELWKHGIHHCDINESSLMYYRNAQGVAVGVLNDYDLASIIEGHQGNGRVGTMPFMAIELLDQEGPAGHITPKYHHVVESLIWVLAWVTLRFEHRDGTRLQCKDRPLQAWLSTQAVACGKEKLVFMMLRQHKVIPPPLQAENWEVVQGCLEVLGVHYVTFKRAPVTIAVEEVFEKWLYNSVKGFVG
ncbi:hypothetical protein BV22DRAFT_1041432 [Leucogyrophana mollusca]|uniref:Uncharacterized protein n=1 Tax=Leucogyrophana mollusca TaxID=85980 RepID=A0ACB8B006_9AGAM|nr:hypothetical protein BV22DRAFT_1041432 [Leucogyrophana mollusca]